MMRLTRALIHYPEREILRQPLVAMVALLSLAAASGCGGSEASSCVATATCPANQAIDAGRDAQQDDRTDITDRRTSDAASDGAGPIDGAPVPDGTRDAQVADGPLADLTRSDGGFQDVSGQDVVSADGRSDVAEASDAAAIDAPVDAAFCELDASRSPSDNPCLISERFGVFAAPVGSDSTGAGTRAAPFRTIARALQAAKADTRRVYACDDGTGYVDGVTLDVTLDGSELFGGFDCTTWKITGAGRTHIHTTSGAALTARGLLLGVTLERFDLASADAVTGASSIAVLLDTAANVVLRNVRVVAGRGGSGQAGPSGDPGRDGSVAGPEQDGAPSECNAQPLDHLGGAWTQATVCGSRGGTGLPSNALSDQQAESGVPVTGVTPANQANGGGGFLGTPAGPGSPGDPGVLGAPNATAGAFSSEGYVTAPTAGAGTEGHTGQGGGGGVKGMTFWGCNLATGGAGGMGGCGGKPGLGGAGGGASVGVLSWSSAVLFDQCEIVAAAGGAGGNGGNGGRGGLGMPGGHGGARWATDAGVLATAGENGGKGGNGGDGGSGAGGNGGPSYALVYKGARPTTSGTALSPGAPGARGVGGFVGGVKAPDGAVGAAGAELML